MVTEQDLKELDELVIKMQMCNHIPVVKISDTPEKAMGRDKAFLEFMKTFANKAS